MSTIDKINSYIGKVKNIDFQAKKESELNIAFPNQKTESLAKKRAKICSGCSENELEPIESERVIDELIPELSSRMCGECFCPLPKLLRQN